MIDRGAANDSNWTGQKIDLITDWIGVDTRTGNGGNGNFDGATGNPTRLILTLSGLPAASYNWRSYHHDTEHMFGDFQIEISTDNGNSFSAPKAFTGTDSTTGGNPDSGAARQTGAGNQDPATLTSTTDLDFTATGQPVVVHLTPLSQTAVHTQFLVLNGFEITSTAPATGPTDIALSANSFSKTANVGTTVGSLSSTDPTPDDTFTYTLVPGAGSAGNSFFDITGSNLITNFDFSAVAGSTQYSVRIQSTDTLGAALQKSFTLTLESDSDDDGLDDDWELTYFTDLATATGSGNNDADSLTNAEEESAGTDPTKADTDNDTLDDADEIARGTDPTKTDSDGDTIGDGDEVAGTNGFVTDPTKADSDNDGFNDNIEIAENTDPTNAGDFPNTALALVINEILADNQNGLTDGFGNREDWIEIFNPNATAINLDAYHLTDNPGSLDKWSFPPVSIPAGGYLVVFASGLDLVDGAGNAHTDFSLGAKGEYLAIVRPDGATVDDTFDPEYPNQFADLSFGKHPTDSSLRYFSTPTPGAANNTGFVDVVRDTTFSIDRGHYAEPFDVEITTLTEGATIRYTTDGSKPSETTGTVYSGPVPITTTTVLRAIAYKTGALSTNVDAHTYLFVDDIANQPSDPPGWPTGWGVHENRDQPADYEMDPRVVNDALGLNEHTIQEALLDIPSVSVSMPIDEFLGARRGIYNHAQTRRETQCSFEYIPTDGTNGIQANCKIEVHGNASRRPTRMHKHSLRLTFTSELGPGKLRYPLFPQSRVEEFNKLVLRACFTDSWALVQWGGSNRYRPNDSMYLRDVWMKDAMRAMGHASGNGDFVHLFVNGLYWGLHDLTERLEDDWYADHIGGAVEDWEVNADILTPGSRWRSMITASRNARSSAAAYEDLKDILDIDNYIDYMLLHFYGDAEDWPTKNGYAAANPISGDGRFRFQVWDQEISLDKFSWSRYGSSSGSAEPWSNIKNNPEFRMDFADRVHKHMFNGGALSQQASIDRFLALCAEIDKAIMAESARWGDIQETVPYATRPGSSNNVDGDFYPPNTDGYFTRERHWILERDNVVGHYIPTLHDESGSRSIIREMRAQRPSLYPSHDAPVFNRHGGAVPRGFELTMNASETIYYTTDGTDPRQPGGNQNPSAIAFTPTGTSTVQVEFIGNTPGSPTTLSHLVPTTGLNLAWTTNDFDDTSWNTAPAGSLGVGYERTGTDYLPAIDVDVRTTMMDNHPGIYTRYEFQVTGSADYINLILRMQYDDGFVAYLNGNRIGARNDPNPLTWESGSGSSHEADAGTFDDIATIDLSANPSLLRDGTNVLAIHGLNSGQGSSDFLIVPQLLGSKTVTSSGDTLTIDGSTPVLARARTTGGEWSALTRAYFSTNDLAVTEIMYRPATNSRAEFLELTNTGPQTVSLEGLHFTQGIDFAFSGSAINSLDPGARLLVIRDTTAFQAVYGNTHDAIIAGEFHNGTALSNDGETITLSDSTGNPVLTFKYNDGAEWPQSPDGDGDSLVLIDPAGDPDDPSNWRPSTTANGNPGNTDTQAYAGAPDDTAAFFAHSFGPAPAPLDTSIDESGNLLVTFTRNSAADDAAFTVETSVDGLTSWQPATATLTNRQTLPGGRESLTYSLTSPLPTIFTRARATSR
ncbi:MAG: lamin tail domain-containing protein [Verrucomicrobiales bacterium]|nr:lamin tail domain-containing protein [Verrucomicrobiales bacterium]